MNALKERYRKEMVPALDERVGTGECDAGTQS